MEWTSYILRRKPIMPNLNPCPNPSSSLQVTLCLFYYVTHREIVRLQDGSEPQLLSSFNEEPVQHRLYLDSGMFKSYDQLYDVLSPVLSAFGVASLHHQILSQNITDDCRNILNCESQRRETLPLVYTIEWLREVVYSETEFALRQSRIESERGNLGMVPTAKKALKLKRVKVKRSREDQDQDCGGDGNAKRKRRRAADDDEKNNCTICLEGLTNFAAALPCSHLFHRRCIVKWLNQSHYCPLCRFEMPTEC